MLWPAPAEDETDLSDLLWDSAGLLSLSDLLDDDAAWPEADSVPLLPLEPHQRGWQPNAAAPLVRPDTDVPFVTTRRVPRVHPTCMAVTFYQHCDVLAHTSDAADAYARCVPDRSSVLRRCSADVRRQSLLL